MITYAIVFLVLYWLYQKQENKVFKEKRKFDKEYRKFEDERFKNQQKMRQEIEDRQHYSNFKLEKISFITNYISTSDMNTKILIQENPEYLDDVTDKDLEEYNDLYVKYLKEHKAFLNSDFYKDTQLSETEFCVKYKYVYKTFKGCNSVLISNPRVYTIYDYNIAKYSNDNSLEKEFNKEFNL